MIDYKEILFCTDFSEDADIAFHHALDLAEKHDAKLHLLHIPHSSYTYMGHVVDEHVPEGSPDGQAFFDGKITKKAEEKVDRAERLARDAHHKAQEASSVLEIASGNLLFIREELERILKTLPEEDS